MNYEELFRKPTIQESFMIAKLQKDLLIVVDDPDSQIFSNWASYIQITCVMAGLLWKHEIPLKTPKPKTVSIPAWREYADSVEQELLAMGFCAEDVAPIHNYLIELCFKRSINPALEGAQSRADFFPLLKAV